MRFVIAILILCLAGFTPTPDWRLVWGFAAHAVSYSNDSDSIDIGYSGGQPIPDAIPDDEETGDPDESTGEEESGADGPSSSGGSQSQGGVFSEESPDVTIPVSVITGEGEEGANSEIGSDDILNSLLGSQALLLGTASGTAGESIALSGEKARAALAARGIGALSISNLLNRRFLSKKDFALVAASSILENKAIEEVVLSLDSLALTYRAQGRLFAVFPLSYPVRIAIYPHALTPETRVEVKFPWYRFFLKTYVSRSELQSSLSAAVDHALAGRDDSLDTKTRLFIEVTETIQARFDTVSGSI